MTTQEYVQSSFFEIIGVAVKRNAEPTQWFSGDILSTKGWLTQFDWENSIAIAHNAQFDGSILEGVLDIHPKQWFCTLFAARPIVSPFSKHGRVSLKVVAEYYNLPDKGTAVHAAIGFRRADFSAQKLKEYADYCMLDVDLAHEIYLRLEKQLPIMEKALIHETTRKVTRPRLLLDKNILIKRLAIARQEKEQALVTALLVDNKVLMSNPKFAEALKNLGVAPPRKTSPATGKETWAFAKSDGEFKDLLEHPDIRVQALVAARFKHKSTLEEKRLEKFIKLAELGTPISIPLRYYGAHTGRFSGGDGLNLQNLPRGGELRQALKAPLGYKIVAADLSQIEARITAWLAGEQSLINAFAKGEDVYCIFASMLYGRAITKADTLERFMGKTAILGLGFGMGWEKLVATVKAQSGIVLDEQEAFRIVRLYRTTYSNIRRLWKRCDDAINTMMMGGMALGEIGPIRIGGEHLGLPNGLSIFYPGLENNGQDRTFLYRGKTKSIWGGGLTENIVQALARIVLARAEVALAQRGLHAVMQVHDELLYCVPDKHVEAVKKALGIAMRAPVPFMPGLPVECEIAVGDNYAEAK